ASLLTLRRAWPERRGEITVWWHMLALPLCTIAWFRLDFLSVLPAACCLVALEQRRSAAKSLAVGIGAKLWPGLLMVGLVARREWRQTRTVVLASVAGLLGWVAFSPSGVA